jgi:hypothetical protein
MYTDCGVISEEEISDGLRLCMGGSVLPVRQKNAGKVSTFKNVSLKAMDAPE